METIPVIDIMSGLAVHAKKGRRECYRPLQSTLCSTAEPEAVIRGLLAFHPFKRIYMADLDAIMGKAPQTDLAIDLTRRFPDIEFWIDRGFPSAGDIPFFRSEPNVRAVVGSESLSEKSLPLLSRLEPDFILSLDFLGDRFLGAESLLDGPELWPERVILMNLARVGSAAGPDFDRLASFNRKHPDRRFIVAGGVRDGHDLRRLKTMRAAGVLVASALHSGAVDSRLIEDSGKTVI